MEERRKFVRTRVHKHAKVLFANSQGSDCNVQNLTNAGAALQILTAIDLPEFFGLTLDAGRSIRACRLVWRNLDKIGVEFLRSAIRSDSRQH